MSGGSSGVKNLRAMFENKTGEPSTSPPSRGRSPNGSISSTNSRQVSKVRTSFVAVERPGESGQPNQWGLRKTSDVSSMAEVREEAIMGNGGSFAGLTKTLTNGTAVSANDGPSLGVILKGSPFENAAGTKSVQEPVSKPAQVQQPAPAKAPEKPRVNGTTNKVASLIGKMQAQGQSNANPPAPAEKPSKPVPANVNTKAATSKPRESPTLPKKSPLPQKKPQDSPTAPNAGSNGAAIKPRGGVAKVQGVIASANKAREERAKVRAKADSPAEEKKATPTEVKPPSVASKPTAASRAHAQKQENAAAEGHSKPRPSLGPSRLPAVATATTAASAARQGTAQEAGEAMRSPTDRRSLASQAPRVANISTKATIARKSSRASLANGDDRAKSRQSAVHKPADEGFLARMTRPTASSAQKAHSKIEVASPPRARQSTTNQPATKKPGRKSVSTAHEGFGAELGDTSVLEPVGEDGPSVSPDQPAFDEGEPGPAEEAPLPPQQAEVSST